MVSVNYSAGGILIGSILIYLAETFGGTIFYNLVLISAPLKILNKNIELNSIYSISIIKQPFF